MTNALRQEKSRLESKIDCLGKAMKAAILVVVIGVIIEAVAEFVDASSASVIAHRVGSILVAIGVASELAVDMWASRYETRLREVNDRIIGEATDRAETAEKQITEIRTPRSLTEVARGELVEALKPYAGRRVDVVMFEQHDREVRPFAESLDNAFSLAGWKSQLSWFSGGFRMYGRAVTIGIANNTTPEEKAELESVAEFVAFALKASGIKSTLAYGFSTTDKLTAIASPVWIVEDAALFRIQIGQKAIFDDVF